jgi:hypothetical protein
MPIILLEAWICLKILVSSVLSSIFLSHDHPYSKSLSQTTISLKTRAFYNTLEIVHPSYGQRLSFTVSVKHRTCRCHCNTAFLSFEGKNIFYFLQRLSSLLESSLVSEVQQIHCKFTCCIAPWNTGTWHPEDKQAVTFVSCCWLNLLCFIKIWVLLSGTPPFQYRTNLKA